MCVCHHVIKYLSARFTYFIAPIGIKMSAREESIPLIPKWKQRNKCELQYYQRGFNFPQRWVFAIMGFLALLNAYSMRICLSIAITEMVAEDPQGNNTDLDKNDYCPAPDVKNPISETGHNVTKTDTAEKYDWSNEMQGLILSSFYWGYILTHLPGGMLAERFGGKYSLGLGILSTAIFTILTPVVVGWGGSTGLIVLRILMGLGEGTTFPALNAMLAQWTPPEERAKIGTLVFAGAQIGTVFANSLSGVVLHYFDWPAVFYVFGSVGISWFIVWVMICYNNPKEHPFISEDELKYLQDRLSAHTHTKPPPVPWRHVIRSVPVWALIAAQIGHDWGFFTMVTDLPLYMSKVLKFKIKENGYLSSLPYLSMWFCSLFTSWLADLMIAKDFMSTTNVRKLGTTIASLGPGVLIIAASYAECDQTLVVILFTVGMTLMGTFYPGMKVNVLDLSPNYSGSLMAVVNGIGACSGIVTPYIVGVLAHNNTLQEWRTVFWVVLAVFIVTNLIFVMYASGDVQYWNEPGFENKLQNKQDSKEQANGSALSTQNGTSKV